MKRICSIEGCGRPLNGHGLCNPHGARMRKYGDPHHGGELKPRGFVQDWIRTVALTYQGDDCLAWPFSISGTGYGSMSFRGVTRQPHRLLCEMVHGIAPEPNMDAAHSCGKGHEGCVNPRHISWKSRHDNMMDRVEHGTAPRGSARADAKLTENNVREIRRLKGLVTNHQLAERFGVAPQYISKVQARQSWGWLAD